MYLPSLRGRSRKEQGIGKKEKGEDQRKREGPSSPFSLSRFPSSPSPFCAGRAGQYLPVSLTNYDINKTLFPLSKRNMTRKWRIKCHGFPCNLMTKSLFLFLEKQKCQYFYAVDDTRCKGATALEGTLTTQPMQLTLTLDIRNQQ